MQENEGSARQLRASFGLALLLMAGLLGVTAATGAGSAADRELSISEDLLAELRDGGEVLLFRHALTDRNQTDADPRARGGCEQQRNLSEAGVAQAETIGDGFRVADLTVERVYASPFCRTRDTAQAFGLGEVIETDALLSLTAAADQAAAQPTMSAAVTLIAESVGGEGLVVMVSHTQNIEALTTLTIDEGDAVVLAPDGQIIGVITAGAWG